MSMMTLYATYTCCTGVQIGYMDGWTKFNKQAQLTWLKEFFPNKFLNHGRKNPFGLDFKIIWGISTKSQEDGAVDSDEAYGRLGFTKAFVADNFNPLTRELRSGHLTMWCINPIDLQNNVARLIQEIEGKAACTTEERERRGTFPEFKLVDVMKSGVFVEHFKGLKIFLKMEFPVDMIKRRPFFNLVKELTGGFDPGNDTVIQKNLKTLTWGLVEERALLYREGKI